MDQERETGGSDYWAAYEGIPLMHTPATPEEERAIAEKGACGCR